MLGGHGQHQKHIVFARNYERLRLTPLQIDLQHSDLSCSRGAFIDIEIEDKVGRTVLLSSHIVRELARNGVVRLDIEPIIDNIRVSRGLQCTVPCEQKDSRSVVFPCLYAFQDWIDINPCITVAVDGKAVAKLDLLTLRSYIL